MTSGHYPPICPCTGSPRRIVRQSPGTVAARAAFTLTELLVVIMVIALLASMVLFAMAGVQEQARRQRTRSQIARLHELVMERWQSYQTRRVPLATVQNDPAQAALARLGAVRELMRMELPDRITDVMDEPVMLPSRPALSRAYQRRVTKLWSPQFQGAECLYMIVARITVGNSNGLEFFSESELGDEDGDGMPEIHDGWGNPIEFIRWPSGFQSPLQDGNPENSRDPFDPLRQFPNNYIIFPLIFSPGPDRQYEIVSDHIDQSSQGRIRYKETSPPNDPYVVPGGRLRLGTPVDVNQDREFGHLDNIHNHMVTVN